MGNENNIVGKATELKNAIIGSAEDKANEVKTDIANKIDDTQKLAENKAAEVKGDIMSSIDDKKKFVENR